MSLRSLLAATATLALTLLSSHAAEVRPWPDHPLIKPYVGSAKIAYAHADFDAFTLPLGPYNGGPDRYAEVRKVEGEVTRLVYQSPPGRTLLEVWRNYADALAGAGFKTQFECEGVKCGGQNAAAGQRQARPPVRGDEAMVHRLLIRGDEGVRLMTAQRAGVDVVLLACDAGADGVGVLLTVVESRAMQGNQVSVDARAIQDGLTRDGHIALYGIQFETDSARLASASDATLAQMAAALRARPGLNVFIVGHTDNTGTLTRNLTLSQQRADAVAAALTARHGVDAARLATRGVANYAPVAGNDAEAGRARNRRVEMVAQ